MDKDTKDGLGAFAAVSGLIAAVAVAIKSLAPDDDDDKKKAY
jgi:hypothetical protein